MIRKTVLYSKGSLIALICSAFVLASPSAHAEWNHGLGTGILFMEVDGVTGLDTPMAGPVVFPIELDHDDTSDLIDTAIGFGGYATNGTLTVGYSFAQIEIVGGGIATVGPATVDAAMNLDITTGEVTLRFPIKQGESAVLEVIGGLRYLRHDMSTNFTSGGAMTGSSNLDNDWTDFLIGLTFDVRFAGNWIWATRLDVASGDSETNTLVRTGFTRAFGRNWSASFNLTLQDLEVGNARPGHSQYYFYDADETSFAVSFAYHWR